MPKNFSAEKLIKDIRLGLADGIAVKKKVAEGDLSILAEIAAALINCLKNKGKIIIFGNGGSAADSLHIAAELVGRFEKEREPLAAISLVSNVSNLTAIANDYGYEEIFAKQLSAIAVPQDIAWGISTSGNSANVLKAINKAKELGLLTIGFSGSSGGQLRKMADLNFIVPSNNTARIQEAHIAVAHLLCKSIEEYFLSE
ncbi:MAG: SIS domain-containing protein [Candidatus Omnitrophota bacterium]